MWTSLKQFSPMWPHSNVFTNVDHIEIFKLMWTMLNVDHVKCGPLFIDLAQIGVHIGKKNKTGDHIGKK